MKAVAALVAIVLAVSGVANAQPQTLVVTDSDVLNFALQSECLAAAFWTAAATGQNLTTAQLGGGGPIIGGQKATLQGAALQLALEFSRDETRHLEYLRAELGTKALPCPKIDIGYAFSNFVQLTLTSLKNTNPYAPFTPYYSFLNLYLAAFIISDPEVFAYNGAATLISDKAYLTAAAGILTVEAYHAGAVRQNLATVGSLPTAYGIDITTATNALAAVRAALQGASVDYGIANKAGSTLSDVDSNALVFSRSVQQTLSFLYQTGNALTPGGFFPNGINGIFSPASLASLGK